MASKQIFLILIFCLGLTSNSSKDMNYYSKEDVLKELDQAGKNNPFIFFPDLGHPYAYPIASRIHLFSDLYNWVIVFEICDYNNRTNSLNTQLIHFGSSLKNLDKTVEYVSNIKFIDLVSEDYLLEISDSNLIINKDVENIVVQGKIIKVEKSLDKYHKMGIKVDSKEIDIISFFRYVNETQPNRLFLEESVLMQNLSYNVPKIMQIDSWHHKSFGYTNGNLYGDLPSSYETFNQIADVLYYRDKDRYSPTIKANNHWSNWPDAGQL